MEKKNSRIYFRCSAKDKENLKNKAKLTNMNMSEYIIVLSENKKIIVAQGLPKLTLELKRIGNNINQIAVVANSQKFVSEDLLKRVISEMESVNKKIDLIWDKINFEED